MPLRFELGPLERLFIGNSILTNSHERAMFIIEGGETPILRAKDVICPNFAVSSIEKLYLCVQRMYLENDTSKYQASYLALAAQTISEDPYLSADLLTADQHIKSGQHYKALKYLRKLIRPEAFAIGKADPYARRVAVGRRN